MADDTALGAVPPAEAQSNEHVKAFFLDLAAKGKDAWNTWRRDPANEGVRVTFAGIDFSEAPRDESEAPRDGIDFSGFKFGDNADFSQCKWRGVKLTVDTKAFAAGRAFFTGGAFGDSVNFTGADFGSWADFTGAAFGNEANFTGAFFVDGAIFTGAAFGWGTNFHDAIFKGWVVFIGMSEEERATNLARGYGKDTEAFTALEKRHQDSWTRWGSSSDRFLTISFESARFDGEANFSGRSFEQVANFTGARFYYPPDFDRVTNEVRIDFTGAHIGFVASGKRAWTRYWTTDSQIPLRLRAFRKIAEGTKNHDLERDLYIEERKAERGVYLRRLLGLDELKKNLEDINKQKKHVWLEWRLQRRARNAHWLRIIATPNKIARLINHLLWIAVMGVYWAFADYGRSFILPAVWLGLSVLLFGFGYAWILAPLMQQAGPLAAKYARAEWLVALGNAVPFVGPLTIDAEIKKFLFCPTNDPTCLPPIPPAWFQSLVIGQNVLSIICVFFIGLALRNYFKIK